MASRTLPGETPPEGTEPALEIREMAATPSGYRVRIGLDRNVVWFEVSQLQLTRVPDGGPYFTKWVYLSSVALFYPSSLAEAQRVAGQHLALYDVALIDTVESIWDLWTKPCQVEAAPVSDGPRLPN